MPESQSDDERDSSVVESDNSDDEKESVNESIQSDNLTVMKRWKAILKDRPVTIVEKIMLTLSVY